MGKLKEQKIEKTEEPADDGKRHPDYVARAKVNGERWETIGAAWKTTVNGKDCYSVKLNTVPAGAWDGGLLLMPPLPERK
ncbi:MAG: hypothetical protein ABL893_10505 [Hyphomicrobium sp.]